MKENQFTTEGTLSSGAVEGLNLKAKLAMRKAYRFKSLDSLQIAFYHTLGDLPGPPWVFIEFVNEPAYYWRICARLGKKSRIVATAHKLAWIVYTLLTKGQAYVDAGQKAFEETQKKRGSKTSKDEHER